jgi:hypothetical protein
LRWTDDAVRDERGLATGFVGVGAVVADGLLRDRRLGDRRQKTEDGRRKTEDGRRKTEDGRRKTEDVEGFALIISVDAHRDAATSDSFSAPLKLANEIASSCLASCVLKSCV